MIDSRFALILLAKFLRHGNISLILTSFSQMIMYIVCMIAFISSSLIKAHDVSTVGSPSSADQNISNNRLQTRYCPCRICPNKLSSLVVITWGSVESDKAKQEQPSGLASASNAARQDAMDSGSTVQLQPDTYDDYWSKMSGNGMRPESVCSRLIQCPPLNVMESYGLQQIFCATFCTLTVRVFLLCELDCDTLLQPHEPDAIGEPGLFARFRYDMLIMI